MPRVSVRRAARQHEQRAGRLECRSPQVRRHGQHRGLRGVEVQVPVVAVDLPQTAEPGDPDPRLGQAQHELLPLVAQRVVLGRDHQRRREVAEAAGQQRGEVRVVAVGGRGGVLVPVPGRLVGGEPVGVGEVRPEAGGRVEEGIEEGERGDALGAPQGRHQRQVAAGRVAVQEQRAGQLGSGGHPVEGGVHVVGRRREPVLGRAAVVHAEHPEPGPVGQAPAERVVHLDVVEHEPTAVQVHDETREGPGRGVEPGRYAVRVDVLDRRDLLPLRGEGLGPVRRAGGGDVVARRGVRRRGRGLLRRPAGPWVQCHGPDCRAAGHPAGP